MSEINLRAVVHDVLRETDLTEPAEVAEETFHRLTRGQYAEALRQTLRQYARTVMVRRRSAPSAARVESAKLTARREMGAAWLRDRVSTMAGWKMVADCYADDLLYVAAQLRRQADEDVAAAERWEKLAAELDGVTVGEYVAGGGTS
jgi:hypothetical protein